MARQGWLALLVIAALTASDSRHSSFACAPAPPSGKPVVNADQTVIIIWDAANKTQHFIRKATFKSEADDFGFLIPSPAQPEPAESDNSAFATLQKLTEPEVVKTKKPIGLPGCGCASLPRAEIEWVTLHSVTVLEEKQVAGFTASVLETKSASALMNWLRDNGYAYSPEIEAWAKPYVEGGWKITALKVTKNAEKKAAKDVTATALRLSFKTDRPLFPYREPESTASAAKLGIEHRLLRIFFLAESRYAGGLTKEQEWTGQAAWAGPVTPADRTKILEQLHLPESTGSANWWLTEFEDSWPYKLAPADVYFSPDENYIRKRPPIIQYVKVSQPADGAVFLVGAAVVLAMWLTRVGRRWL